MQRTILLEKHCFEIDILRTYPSLQFVFQLFCIPLQYLKVAFA